jgi:hypothetical protein
MGREQPSLLERLGAIQPSFPRAARAQRRCLTVLVSITHSRPPFGGQKRELFEALPAATIIPAACDSATPDGWRLVLGDPDNRRSTRIRSISAAPVAPTLINESCTR